MPNRIANLRIGTPFPGDNAPAVRYYLEDHLGNCSFTLETSGALFSREDFAARAQAAKKAFEKETSYGSFAKKRYRFCGKERDEESRLYYYGARYYAPWTCRFVSVDPMAGEYPFYTPYQYAGNKPINWIDFKGLAPQNNNSKDPSSGPIAPSNPDTTANQQSGGAVIYGDESLMQRFKTLLQTCTGYIFADADGQLAITGNVADYDPTKYSQELRQLVKDLVDFKQDTIPFYLVDGDDEVFFDGYINGTFDLEDFENVSNPEFVAAKLGHIFEERIVMQDPFKYSSIVSDYRTNNGFLTKSIYNKYDKEFSKAHLNEANAKEVDIFNEITKSNINRNEEIKNLKNRKTDKEGVFTTGFLYGEVIYFIFFKTESISSNHLQIIGTRKGNYSKISKDHEKDIIKFYLDNVSK